MNSLTEFAIGLAIGLATAVAVVSSVVVRNAEPWLTITGLAMGTIGGLTVAYLVFLSLMGRGFSP